MDLLARDKRGGFIQIEMTKKCNIPVMFGGVKYYAMALPVTDPRMVGMYGLFPNDLTWNERVAINQSSVALVHTRSGGSVIQDNKIIGKIVELGDDWIFAEAIRQVVANSRSEYELITEPKRPTD